MNAEGKKLSSFSEISNEAISFFQSLIGKKDDRVIGCSRDILNEIVQTTLPVDATLELSKEVTAEEIKSVMFFKL